jgi:acyl-coenzyme A thioesterase PaaI-like protein
MAEKAIQDFYEDAVSHCYGCGRLNDEGLQIKSFWIGDEVVCNYLPRPYHTAIPGYVYGGLIASLIDCHSTGAAAAAAYRAEGRQIDTESRIRYVTASLHVDYLQPTPIDQILTIRATVNEIKGRKATVSSKLFAGDEECARGEVVVVQMPPEWIEDGVSS